MRSRAFVRVNSAPIEDLAARIQRSLADLPPDVLENKNAKHLLETPPSEWLFKFVMIQIMRPGDRRDKRHVDGGASLLHLGLSVFGHRTLVFWEEGRDQPHRATQTAGDMYLSSPALFEHQVLHEDADGDGLLPMDDMGPCKVALQLRCNIFSHNRATTPPAGPTELRLAAGRAVLEWLTTASLILPNRTDVEQCLGQARCADPPTQRLKRKAVDRSGERLLKRCLAGDAPPGADSDFENA